MTTTDIDALWKEAPKVEGALGDDGIYQVSFGQPVRRFVSGGMSALIEFPFSVTEGDSAGEKAKSTIFYITEDEPNQKGLDQLKKIVDQVDPNLRENSTFTQSLEALESLLPGRTGRINQNTYKERVYFNIVDINYATPPVPTTKKSAIDFNKLNADLASEQDIPF